MQVFLSWSGERSLALANALRDYLPLVIQSITPWFSPDDIDKGSRWLTDLTNQLQKQSVAIVCITPESVNSPWLLFESGALSKALDASWVCPVLLDIEPTEIKGPLAQFQATRVTKDDVRKLLGTLNKRLDTPLADPQIDRLHSVLWNDFETKIKAIPKPPTPGSSPHRSQVDLLSEVLERVRGIERRIANTPSRTELALNAELFAPLSRRHSFSDNPRIAEITEKLEKFRRLFDESAMRVGVLEKELQTLPEKDIESRRAVQIALESERVRQGSFEAEIGRAGAKLRRANQIGR